MDDLTQYQIAQAKEEHSEATRFFREVNGVERTIIQHIVSAIEPKYIRALRQLGTSKLNTSILELFEHLFGTYGDATPSDLKELTTRVESLQFLPSEPVDTVFSKMNNLAAINEITNTLFSATQKLIMAYILFQKCHI